MISFVLRPFCKDTSCGGCNPTNKIIFKVIYVLFFLLWQNLDLTKRKMIHEGPLVWKVNRDKSIGKSLERVERREWESLPVGSRLIHSFQLAVVFYNIWAFVGALLVCLLSVNRVTYSSRNVAENYPTWVLSSSPEESLQWVFCGLASFEFLPWGSITFNSCNSQMIFPQSILKWIIKNEIKKDSFQISF